MRPEELEQLDAAIAVEVMGWRLFESCGHTWATTRPPEVKEIQQIGDRLMFAGSRFGFFAPGWSPSTDIAAAWEVVERIPSSHKYHGVQVSAMCHDRRECKILLGPDEGWRVLQTGAGTAPLAICEAALQWARRSDKR